jgi:hypothetical protein
VSSVVPSQRRGFSVTAGQHILSSDPQPRKGKGASVAQQDGSPSGQSTGLAKSGLVQHTEQLSSMEPSIRRG